MYLPWPSSRANGIRLGEIFAIADDGMTDPKNRGAVIRLCRPLPLSKRSMRWRDRQVAGVKPAVSGNYWTSLVRILLPAVLLTAGMNPLDYLHTRGAILRGVWKGGKADPPAAVATSGADPP